MLHHKLLLENETMELFGFELYFYHPYDDSHSFYISLNEESSYSNALSDIAAKLDFSLDTMTGIEKRIMNTIGDYYLNGCETFVSGNPTSKGGITYTLFITPLFFIVGEEY